MGQLLKFITENEDLTQMWEAGIIISIGLMGAYWPIDPRCVEELATATTAEAPEVEHRMTATIIM